MTLTICADCEQKLLKVADLEAFHEQEGWAFLEIVVTNSNFQLPTTCLLLPWQQNENSEHIHACPIKDTNLPIFIFLNKP